MRSWFTSLSIFMLVPLYFSIPVYAQSVTTDLPMASEESPTVETSTSPFVMEEPTDPITALGELRKMLRRLPSDVTVRLKLSQALLRIGDLESAIEESRAAIKLQPDLGKTHLQLGLALIAKQDWRAATAALKDALKLEPDLAQAHYGLGTIQQSLGNPKAAIQSYRQAIELQPYFPDAHYRVASLLKTSGHLREALLHMEAAAIGGVPQARLFLGNAYSNGQGTEKNLGLAIFWWTQAAELGQQPAVDSLAKLRRQLLAPELPVARRADLHRAFRVYQDKLWNEFPDIKRMGDQQSLGSVLILQSRAEEAIPVLLKECYALNDDAHAELATLYEAGLDQHLPPFDKRILTCFETTAAEGYVPAKKSLVRIYTTGLGVAPDPVKAKATLKDLPKLDMLSLSDELGL